MKVLTPASDPGASATVQRISRLSHAAVDYRPQASAQRALQQQLDARHSSAFATTEAVQGAKGGVVQRVRGRSKSLPARLRTPQQQAVVVPPPQPQWAQVVPGPQPQQAQEVPGLQPQQGQLLPNPPQLIQQPQVVPQPQLVPQPQVLPQPQPIEEEIQPVVDGHRDGEEQQGSEKSLGRRTVDYLMTGGPNQKPVLPIRTLVRDTPGPTGGLGMVGNIAASGMKALNSFGYWNQYAKYVPYVQTAASAISATGDALAIGKTVYKYVTKPGDEKKQQKRRNKMWLRGADLTSNALNIGSSMVVDPTIGTYLSLAGSALGIGVQGVATNQAYNASQGQDPTLDKAGAAVTVTDLLSNAYSVGSGIHSLVKGSSPALDTASSVIGAVPPVLAGVMTGVKEVKKKMSKKSASEPSENTRLINGDIEEGRYG